MSIPITQDRLHATRTRIYSQSSQYADTDVVYTSPQPPQSARIPLVGLQKHSQKVAPTPLAVRIGLAFSLGNNAFL